MFNPKDAYSGFSVNNLELARDFYSDKLGLKIIEVGYGATIVLPGGARVFFYPKGDDHSAANFTILNLVVTDIDQAVTELKARGVVFESYDYTDENDIQRGIQKNMGPDIAWFKDPAGNIMSVMQDA